jgi:hypothetical protein
MEKKVIYNNGNSELSVKFDGEIVTIEQKADGVGHNSIFMYEDELEDIYKFVKENAPSSIVPNDKKRLKHIERKVQEMLSLADSEGYAEVNILAIYNDMIWLIEQAEKVERYEKVLKQIASHELFTESYFCDLEANELIYKAQEALEGEAK